MRESNKGVKTHLTRIKRLYNKGLRKVKRIMKRMMNRISKSKKFNRYCDSMLRMYGNGNVSMPA